MLTEKQKRFIDFYVELGNASEAAIKAGYSKKTAGVVGAENLKKPYLQKAIDERLAELKTKRTADAQEVMEYLTAVMRGKMQEEIVVVLMDADGTTYPKTLKKQVSVASRNKAAEMLAKRFGLQTDKIQLDIKPIVIGGDDLV